MIFEFLTPVDESLQNYAQHLAQGTLGVAMHFINAEEQLAASTISIALLTIDDSRGNGTHDVHSDFITLRKAIYGLYRGNWHFQVADLGTLKQGATIQDTYFALKEIITALAKQNILPLIIGGSQDLTYPIYRAFDQLDQMVNLVTIDHQLDLMNEEQNPANNFLKKIILEEPVNLKNFSNLGYQTYFNHQEEIELIDKLYFEAYRIGEISDNMSLCEPILRDADVVSIDFQSIKSNERNDQLFLQPNGFDGKQICTLARYSGISEKLAVMGIFNIDYSAKVDILVAQMVWYFMEGYNFRVKEFPFINKDNLIKYYVPIADEVLVFYKSNLTARWWIEINQQSENIGPNYLFPCSEVDYQLAVQQQIPERWWKAVKKLDV